MLPIVLAGCWHHLVTGWLLNVMCTGWLLVLDCGLGHWYRKAGPLVCIAWARLGRSP